MTNYNDFPILPDELYKQMENEYNTDTSYDESMLSEIYSYIFALTKSINIIEGLRNKDKEMFVDFSNEMLTKFTQYYPNLKTKTIKENKNIFAIFNYLINCLKIIEKIKNNKKNQNIIDFCKNIKNIILKFFNNIFSSLETQYIKFFKHL